MKRFWVLEERTNPKLRPLQELNEILYLKYIISLQERWTQPSRTPMVNPKGISPLSFTSLTTSFAHNTRPIPAEAHQPVAEHLVKTALPPKQQSSSSSSINNNNNNNNNHGNSKPITTITIITITTIITTITMESPLRPQLGLRIIITVRGRS